MATKSVVVGAAVGSGGLLLLWLALSVRQVPAIPPAPATLGSRGTQILQTAQLAQELAAPGAPLAPAAVPSPGSPAAQMGPLLDRIRKMEERLLLLESKRLELLSGNQSLEREIVAKQSQALARTRAEWRLQAWQSLLGLSATQVDSLRTLLMSWTTADQGQTADQALWMAREGDLRSQLSVEQAGKLHDAVVHQTQTIWGSLGQTIGRSIGASSEDQVRFQQALGAYAAPSAMLLSEAHGGQWNALTAEAATRIRPLLSGDQVALLDKYLKMVAGP